MLGCDWIRPNVSRMVEEKGEERKKENGRIRNKEEGKLRRMFDRKKGSGELQEIICGM